MQLNLKPGITFDEMFELIQARISLTQAGLTLWSWRVQRASPHNLREIEIIYCKALDRLWEAQQRAAGLAA